MPQSLDDVKILQNMQGVTVMEVAEGADGWQIVVDSPFNRRIHHNTPMKLSGPAAGSDLVKTAADPAGVDCLGTFNNCGAGKTPWGTYLTCEENFNGYFGSTVADFKCLTTTSVTASWPRPATATRSSTSASTCRRTRTSRVAPVMSSRSIRRLPLPPRSSARRLAASSMKTLRRRGP